MLVNLSKILLVLCHSHCHVLLTMAAAAIYRKFKKLGLVPKHGKKHNQGHPRVKHPDDDDEEDRDT